MKITTSRFGTVTVEDDVIFTFNDGLPGFEQSQRFIFLPHLTPDGSTSPFSWMQSIDDGALAFPVISPWDVEEEYSPTVQGNVLRELNISSIQDDAKIWAIVTIPRDHPEMATVNLLAPVLINKRSRLARQVILLNDENYSLRTPLRRRQPAQNTETENDDYGKSEPAARRNIAVAS